MTFPRLVSRRAWIAFWALLVVFAIGATLACLPTVPIRATGLAVASPDDETRIAVLTIGGEPEIRSGAEATIELGGREMTGSVVAIEPMTPDEVMRRLSLPWPTAAMVSGQVTVAWVDPVAAAAISPGAVGSAEVAVGSRQAGSYLPFVGRFFRSDA